MEDTRTYEELQKSNERLTEILRHLIPDRLPGVFFICGHVGPYDRNGLPERVMLCPSYGSDVVEIYERMKV
jgi:hypothetical protein